MLRRPLSGVLCLFAVAASAADGENLVRPGRFNVPLSPPLSPRAALKTFRFAEPGFRIELVASEPLIEDPVAMTFDEDGRLYVAEMRGFTLDMKGKDEFEPTGRISVLEDVDGDGVMDRSVVYLDKLVLPRSICRINGGLLVAEHDKLWFTKDTDGDLRADLKELVDAEYATSGSVEHRPNGLMLALDNWIYNGASTKRYQFKDGRWLIDQVQKRGQWGITQDDFGRLYYNFNWSQLHADMLPPKYVDRNPNFEATFAINVGLLPDQKVYPIRPNTAVNRGYTPGVLDKRGYLTAFASACSPLIYRGGMLGGAFDGNAFVCGPCANIVKRNLVTREGVVVKAEGAYPNRDFLASTDERFRPVFMSNGPDGGLYITDMYRGVIQQWTYMTPYLREESRLRELESPVRLGRIYRVVREGAKAQSGIRLSALSNEELTKLIADENGWIRDTAQRLLVERQARDAEETLLKIVTGADDARARVQALWTLEGIGFNEPDRLLGNLADAAPEVQIASMRVVEARMGGTSPGIRARFVQSLASLAATAPEPTQLQIILTLGNVSATESLPTLMALIRDNAEQVIMREALMSSVGGHELRMLTEMMKSDYWPEPTIGRSLLIESLVSAVVAGAESDSIAGMLTWLDNPVAGIGWRESAVLSGVSVRARQQRREPIRLKAKPAFVSRVNSIAEPGLRRALTKLSERLAWPGHEPVRKSASKDVKPLSAADEKRFVKGRQLFANYCAACHGIDGGGFKPLGPPLIDSEWVSGVEGRLIRIVLHGMEGPVTVAGKVYEPPNILPAMPAVSTLPSQEIGEILTYIRRAWGHTAAPVDAGTIQKLRQLNYGRLTAWRAEELMKIQAGESLETGYRKTESSEERK